MGSSESSLYMKKLEENVQQFPVFMYSTTICPYCVRAKRLLNDLGVPYECVELNKLPDRSQYADALLRRTGQPTVPQLFVCGQWIGGYAELMALSQTGGLFEKLSTCAPQYQQTYGGRQQQQL